MAAARLVILCATILSSPLIFSFPCLRWGPHKKKKQRKALPPGSTYFEAPGSQTGEVASALTRGAAGYGLAL